jgi:AcrR family transcriptional regulator
VNPAPPKRRRVRALPPDDRRAALVAATIPLLREHGLAVSTRQIAEAAGVAEGTIFNVFPDKQSLLSAAITAAFDPEPVRQAFDRIPRVAPIPGGAANEWRRADLRRRLIHAVEVLDVRVAQNEALLPVLRTAAPIADLRPAREGLIRAVATVIEPDADLLRLPSVTAASLILSLLFVNRQHIITPTLERLKPDAFVSLLLDGLFAPVQGETSC